MNPTSQLRFLDGHNDTLRSIYLSEHGERSFFERSDCGHIDLPRAIEGNLAGGFFAINAPSEQKWGDRTPLDPSTEKASYNIPLPPPLKRSYAREFSLGQIDLLRDWEAQSNAAMRIVTTTDEFGYCIEGPTLAAVMHFEGADAVDPALGDLQDYYDRGLRSLGITWSRPNAFGHGVPFRFPHSPDTGPGLSGAGRELVRACDNLGILIDLSHLNEKGFWDVAGITTSPLVISHTGVHALCPSTRNLTDKQIDAVGESGGLIGINFCVAFIRSDGLLEVDTPLSEIVRHIDYVAERIGIDHVACGSDFDGATIPGEMGDVTGLPKLARTLRKSGYDDSTLRKIANENWLRVIAGVWK